MTNIGTKREFAETAMKDARPAQALVKQTALLVLLGWSLLMDDAQGK